MKVNGCRAIGILGMAGLLVAGTGCKNLPGTPGAQGAALGGVSGAAIGAAVGGSENRLLGALLGGAIGAGGGYLLGANSDKILNRDKSGAERAVNNAQTAPATPEQARNAATADVNQDGFVTMDEVVAMQKAGISDQEILNRLRKTGQVFDLTPAQQDYLRQQGVSSDVVAAMNGLNRDERQRVLNQNSPESKEVIGRPGSTPSAR